jgi:hypothetical protein
MAPDSLSSSARERNSASAASFPIPRHREALDPYGASSLTQAGPRTAPGLTAASAEVDEASVEVPLIRLAHGRSGDKGDTANIGVIARRAEFVALLASVLTADVVRNCLAHLVEGEVTRFDWPGLNGWNFVLSHALGGGGVASLRYDPQGKSYAQILMDLPIRVPQRWTEAGGLLYGANISPSASSIL